MILVDTSIWIDHFRGRDTALPIVLEQGLARLHPFVLGELLLSGLPDDERIDPLKRTRPAPVATPSEAAAFISWAGLAGTGVGYVDANLLLSARLAGDGQVLTSDNRLQVQAERLGVAFAG